MEQFRNLSLILMSLLLCFCFTDGAITSWALDGGSVTSAVDASFSKSIAEDQTTIFTLVATTGATSVETYAIGTQTTAGQFEIVTATSGVVTLASSQTLDYETATSLTITVVATDDISGAGTATVVISVTDVNEFTPTFSKPSSATVSVEVADKSTANTAVYTVVAADADGTGNTVAYAIASGDTNSDFAIGTSSGAITVAKVLDKATTPTYALIVTATDAGTSPNTGTVTISVTVCDPCSSDNGVGAVSVSIIALLTTSVMSLYNVM